MNEGLVQNKILKYLKNLQQEGKPLWVDKRQAGGFSYKKGVPDIYGCVNGFHFEIEVKDVGGKRSPMQEKYETIFKNSGAIYLCVETLEEVKKTFEKLL